MNQCHDIERWILERAAGLPLDADAEQRLRDHLERDRCPACTARAVVLGGLGQALGEGRVPAEYPDAVARERFHARFMERLAAEASTAAAAGDVEPAPASEGSLTRRPATTAHAPASRYDAWSWWRVLRSGWVWAAAASVVIAGIWAWTGADRLRDRDPGALVRVAVTSSGSNETRIATAGQGNSPEFSGTVWAQRRALLTSGAAGRDGWEEHLDREGERQSVAEARFAWGQL